MALMEGRYGVLVGLTSALGTAAVLFMGVRHVVEGVLTVGQLWMALRYLDKLYEPLKTISKKAAGIQSYLASAERAFALLDEQPEVPERADARPIARAAGRLAFRQVCFAYGPDRPVLHDVSFAIAPGTRLGIVGATGAGKTTLISLLTRFYDPSNGAILLDGVDLRDYKLADLRRQFAVVLQDPVLFSLSIADNIAYAAPGASREHVVAAAQAANAREFIERLPQGYDTQVGERGVKLSGGQRQRIALARAFLKDSPVLILDEPTSSVDAKTESAIVDALERLKQGRTVIVISHRPTTLAGCSALLTIDGGRVVADTTPAAVEALPTPPPPSRTPTRALSETRRENLLAHPAVQAWRQLHPDRVVPDRITPAKFKPNKPRPNLTVYRLEGVGVDSAAVIAKRCTQGGGQIERTVYERILPHVPLAGPRYYGTVSGSHEDHAEDVCWLFIGEIQGEKYDMLRPDHRAAAARWLGILHTEAQSAADHAGLPDGGPSRYRDQMRATRDLIRAQVDNPAFSAEDVAFLDVLVARFNELDEDWDRLARACTGLPPPLIHGDFNTKNLRVQASPQGAQIGAFDWEDAGRAVPGIDLAQAGDPSCRLSASPDLATYRAGPDETPADRIPVQAALWRGPCQHLPEDLAGARRRRRGGRRDRRQRAGHRPLDRTGGARPVCAEADLRHPDEPCWSPARARRCHRESVSRDGSTPRQGDRRPDSRGRRGAHARHVRRVAPRTPDAALGQGTARRQAVRRHLRVGRARRPERGRAPRRGTPVAQAATRSGTALSPARGARLEDLRDRRAALRRPEGLPGHHGGGEVR